MKCNSYLELEIETLNLNSLIVDLLNKFSIHYIKDLWVLTRKDLKKIGLSDLQVNQIIIQMQLIGLDLNKKKY